MLATAADLLHRAFLVVLLGVAPFAAPLDVRAPTDAVTIAVRLAIGGGLLIALLAGAYALRRRATAVAALLLALAITSLAFALIFRGESGPFGRAVFVASPLAWCAIASGALRALRPSVSWWRGLAIGISCSAVVMLLSIGRIGSRAAMWQAATATDPGNERASLVSARTWLAAGSPDQALEIARACLRVAPRSCICAGEVAAELLLTWRPAEALAALDGDGRAAACADESAGFVGLRADSLARVGRYDEAAPLVDRALSLDGSDPHALFAQALSLAARGEGARALPLARRALATGTLGSPAARLVAELEIVLDQLDLAGQELRALQTTHPSEAWIVFDLAQVDDKRDRYHDAREGYLAALRLDPKLGDARFALAMLTLRHGARDEAKYNAEQLAALLPNDPRLPALRARLEAP